MTPTPVDERTIGASPDAIWSILDDAATLRRVLPGCESLERIGPDRFAAVLAVRTQFMTVRADATILLDDLDPPRHLRMSVDGRPRGLGGSFATSVPIDLAPDGDRTLVRYSVEVRVTGVLASLGEAAVRDAMRRQIDELVGNLERELAPR